MVRTCAMGVTQLLIIVGCAFNTVAADDPPETISSMIDTWKQRESTIRTLRFEWSANRYITPRSPEASGPADDPLRLPSTFVQHTVLLFDSNKMRYDFVRTYKNESGAIQKSPFISVFDGLQAKSLWSELGSGLQPYGTIYKSTEQHRELSSVPLAPIMLACRPLGYGNDRIQFPTAELGSGWSYELGESNGLINLIRKSGSTVLEAWVDPQRQYVVSRFTISSGGHVSWKCALEYKSTQYPVLPSEWVLESFSKLGLLGVHSVKVTKCEINPKLASSEFTFEYPVGCVVHDQQSNKQFIVQPPSHMREILPRERRVPPEILMTTKTGEAAPIGARPGMGTFLTRSILVVALLAIVAVAARALLLRG